ncbi:conserved hypothetical protein [Shewanella denitrificans OS217]|uniref:T6SS Phospholipase effector Tle1-like catalytic domain-containing protein n=1 Tax=Shewanella denitrificans (strain OS217 / ATCC BAA-1090 / DSM 15013) TaxID=318161 RepID=Q12QW8_SHEDO|nr:DUF2235 domain-containing protein [Shewanella denitrificans]ABE54158.1 conserved hypothetical protein [Shewanella denitrificans OS217]
MANLVICCDGTWNNPQQEDNGVPSPTNVYKLANAIAPLDNNGDKQMVYYHPGLGGEDSGLKDAIVDGALGVSIKRHISSAYYWLATHYKPGDSVSVFGFSRGAFTARSLCGLLKQGLLDFKGLSEKESWQRTHDLYDFYKRVGAALTPSFFMDNAAPFKVHFLGVWDTVGALGIPNDLEFLNLFDDPERWRFHDTVLGDNVSIARHAMALDEKRSSFTVTRWSNADSHNNAKEMWFSGVHSDVGGGYADCGLADISLNWMIEEATKVSEQGNKLTFRPGISALMKPDPNAVLHNSYKGVFSKLRSRPRNIGAVLPANEAYFHSSVFARQASSPLAYPAYWPTQSLAVGESLAVDVFAKKHWNPANLYMEKGQKYCFSATGQWQDSKDTCDWKGTEHGNLTGGDIVRAASSLWGITERAFMKITKNKFTDFWGTKRVESLEWFVAVGCIANDDGVLNAVNNDGSPEPHKYFALPDHEQHGLEVKNSGYFYAFANDVWSLYNNNHGSITLTITRIE